MFQGADASRGALLGDSSGGCGREGANVPASGRSGKRLDGVSGRQVATEGSRGLASRYADPAV